MSQGSTQQLFQKVADRVRAAGVFESVAAAPDALTCAARGVESEAAYGVTAEDQLWVGLYTPDRWLSESIEAELMHVGDKIEELLEEELVDQGYEAGRLPVEHFRNDQKLFVFRSPVDVAVDDERAAETIAQVLLAYEACFGELGDMKPADETV